MNFRHYCCGALLFACLTVLAGCGTPGAPMPPSLELPKAVSDLHAARKGDKVTLTWTVPSQTTDLQTVRHMGATRICRSLKVAMNQCGTPVAEIPRPQLAVVTAQAKNGVQQAQASHTDTLPPELQQQSPTGLIHYAVEVLNEDKRSAGLSNQVQVPLAPTLPAPDDFKAQVGAGCVALSWSGILHEHEVPELRHIYRVYRREEGTGNEVVAGELSLTSSQQASFLDPAIEWERTYEYRVTAVTVLTLSGRLPVQVEGDDSAPVRVFAHDVFPPAVPSGLQAVFSGVGQQAFIDLTWAPNTDADLAGYNVYRTVEGEQALKINSELVKTPAFRDSKVESGKIYFYTVSAVDLRGNESARSEETSEKAP